MTETISSTCMHSVLYNGYNKSFPFNTALFKNINLFVDKVKRLWCLEVNFLENEI